MDASVAAKTAKNFQRSLRFMPWGLENGVVRAIGTAALASAEIVASQTRPPSYLDAASGVKRPAGARSAARQPVPRPFLREQSMPMSRSSSFPPSLRLEPTSRSRFDSLAGLVAADEAVTGGGISGGAARPDGGVCDAGRLVTREMLASVVP